MVIQMQKSHLEISGFKLYCQMLGLTHHGLLVGVCCILFKVALLVLVLLARFANPLFINSDITTTPANTSTKLVINGNPNMVTFLCFIEVVNCR